MTPPDASIPSGSEDETANEAGITPALLETIGDAFNANDIDAVMSHFAEDSIFDTVRGPDVEGLRYEGKEAIRAAFQALFDSTETVNWAPLDTRVAGNKAYCEFRRTATLKTGQKQDYLAMDIMTFRDGLIIRKDSYCKHRTG